LNIFYFVNATLSCGTIQHNLSIGRRYTTSALVNSVVSVIQNILI